MPLSKEDKPIQLRYFVHFQANTHEEGMSLIPQL